ncbi:MAG: ribonuclease HII [Firmicutes bacterium]|nr:ribonuclease HII [Bacillota bacterium]MBQ6260266.1 ribonuclease HII [Bacillota bacterium]MBR0113759.1 ribonuclease HII [Bacillota bacterium]MBR0442431.1 ribonuclease HII [Bacillota bacterium]
MTKAERLEAQKARLEEMLRYERELWASGCRYIAGVDEVGRGPLAGPVVTAAVILPEDFDLLGVDDSKKLTPKKRDELFEKIKEAAVCWAVGRREPGRIDEINILNATKEAMLDAVNGLSVRPDHVLIDAVKLPSLEIPQTSLIHGDALSVSIAAASILAKVTRDREMEEMARVWPGYSFEKNKGYGTKAHYEGLKALGPCPIHRKTFL